MSSPRYGLPTAVAMITGIVIGSGIFFKSDNILIATGGSVSLGVFLFVLAALGIVFGSLTIAQLAAGTEQTGGIIAYFEQAWGLRAASAFGWFQVFLYYPTLTAVISWVLAHYLCTLFAWPDTLPLQLILSSLTIVLLTGLNLAAARLGALLQNAAALIKLLPLLVIAAAGLFWGDVSALNAAPASNTLPAAAWFSAVGPVAFAFDGWVMATAITPDLKNPRRDLPLALTLAPLLILALYIAYFVGISALLGPAEIIRLGDRHVALAAALLFGPWGAKLLLIFVIISVLGTLNGVILASLRLPAALAQRGVLPKAQFFAAASSPGPACLALALALFWLAAHTLLVQSALLPNSDISEFFVIISYALYIALYLKVILHWLHQHSGHFFTGFLFPLLAAVGSFFILYFGGKTPYFAFGLLLSALILLLGAHYG